MQPLKEAGRLSKNIPMPRTILEQEYPPDTYMGLQLNWHHPSHMWANWSCSAIDDSVRAVRRAIADATAQIIPYILWVHPSINGLPLHPLEFPVSLTSNALPSPTQPQVDKVRCLLCVEIDSPCWYQGSEVCVQCSSQRMVCGGGVPPLVENPALHVPRLERRRALLAKLGRFLWEDFLRPNGKFVKRCCLCSSDLNRTPPSIRVHRRP